MGSAQALHNVNAQSSPVQASLNIPGLIAKIDANSHFLGPSFNREAEALPKPGGPPPRLSNQYALFLTSKLRSQVGGSRYGFFFSPITNRWGIPCGFGLKGGGESSANGWGNPATQNAGWGTSGANQASPQGQWGGTQNRNPAGPNGSPSPSTSLKPTQSTNGPVQQPGSPSTPQNNSQTNGTNNSTGSGPQQSNPQGATGAGSWAQAAGKGLAVGNSSNGDAQKRQQLKNIREALLSTDGWGGENVNQETSWDLPNSPEPNKDSVTPHWKGVNNGCELWENNLRNGGAVPPKPQQAPWGRAPSSNFGGTWGEEDESSDPSSVWHLQNAPPHWSGNSGSNPQGMWAQKKEWNGGACYDHPAPHNNHAIEVATGPTEWAGPPKPAAHIAAHTGPSAGPHGPSHIPPAHGGPAVQAPSGQWTGSNKDVKQQSGGWEQPSPPPMRRDDGTAVWGNPASQINVSRWKEGGNPLNRQGLPPPPQNRMPGPAVMKPDQRVWSSHGRNGGWVDTQHDVGAAWVEEQKGSWQNSSIMSPSWLTKPKTPTGGSAGWSEHDGELAHWSNKVPKGLKGVANDIYSKQQIRALLELGLKKEEVNAGLPLDDHITFQDLPGSNFTRYPHAAPLLPLNSQIGPSNHGAQQVNMLKESIQLAVQGGYLNPTIVSQSMPPNVSHMVYQLLQLLNHLYDLQRQPIRGGMPNVQSLINQTKQRIQTLQHQISAQQSAHIKQPTPQPHHPQHHINSHLAGPPVSQNDIFKQGLPDSIYKNFSQLYVTGENSGHQGSRLPQWMSGAVESEEPTFIKAPGTGKTNLQQIHSSPALPTLLPSSSTWSQSNNVTDSVWHSANADLEGQAEKIGFGVETQWSAGINTESLSLNIQPFEPGKQWKLKNVEDDPNRTPGSVVMSPLQLNSNSIKHSELFNAIGKSTSSSNNSSGGEVGASLSSPPFSTNTWSFNSESALPAANSPTSGDNKLGVTGKVASWSDGQGIRGNLASELWGTSPLVAANKSRGPPPGMGGTNPNKLVGSWGPLSRSTSWSGDQKNSANSALQTTHPPWTTSQSPSRWLLLKNLSSQVDDSTLETLCKQHGPLMNYYPYINHAFALINYSSPEEAFKAQGNLNNCPLNNTTIVAEFISENEVRQILSQSGRQVGHASGGPSSAWASSVRGSTPQSSVSNSEPWSNTASASLWGSAASGSSLWATTDLEDQ